MDTKTSSDFTQPTLNSSTLGLTTAQKDRAQGHFKRAQDQFKLKHYNEAIQELRDAIQIDASNSEYHAWLAKVQLKRGLLGMATISLRQALRLNPSDAVALECQKQMDAQTNQQQAPKTNRSSNLLGGLFSKK
ncbi:tetratricopeptide repeat protein [Leptolyngbya sp. AN02str]|uniref:tetratricopeptide repeat protein n=1 Tax=Leptolyngbya sp. AN02str TaxID=3423363 RepID=UPI003D31A0A8